MWTTIGAVFKFIMLFVGNWMERSKEKKELKKEALNEVKEGIKRRDPSRITAGFDRINRL